MSQIPDQFRSEAKVRIDGAAVVAPVLAERRIEVDELTKAAFVTELLLSNDAMKRIAEQSGTSAQPDESDEAVLENLRAAVNLEGGENDVYVVSAIQADPKLSLQLLKTALTALGETARAVVDNDASNEIKVLEQKIQALESKLNEAAPARTVPGATPGSNVKQALPDPQDPRYQVLKNEMDTLLKRRDDVRAARDREALAHPDLFRVIEEPVEPSAPFSPNRIALHSLILVSALAIAALLAMLANLLRPTLNSSENLREVTGLPVLGSVGVSDSPAYQRIHRFSRLVFVAALATLAVLFLGLIMLESYGLNLHHLSV